MEDSGLGDDILTDEVEDLHGMSVRQLQLERVRVQRQVARLLTRQNVLLAEMKKLLLWILIAVASHVGVQGLEAAVSA